MHSFQGQLFLFLSIENQFKLRRYFLSSINLDRPMFIYQADFIIEKNHALC